MFKVNNKNTGTTTPVLESLFNKVAVLQVKVHEKTSDYWVKLNIFKVVRSWWYYLFKVHNKGIKTTSIDVVLVSLLLTLNLSRITFVAEKYRIHFNWRIWEKKTETNFKFLECSTSSNNEFIHAQNLWNIKAPRLRYIGFLGPLRWVKIYSADVSQTNPTG